MTATLKFVPSSLLALSLAACAAASPHAGLSPAAAPAAAKPSWTSPRTDDNPYPSTYRAKASGTVAIVGGTVLTAAGPRIPDGRVIIADNRIIAVGGSDVAIPSGARIIDARGKWVTPGIIDPHMHIASGGVVELLETNDPNTAQLFVENALLAGSPDIVRTVANGVTTAQILPGSANIVGGRSVTLKLVPASTIQAMKFPGAPYGLKMACGENPTRVYGPRGRAPATRMAVIALMRSIFYNASEGERRWRDYEGKPEGSRGESPRRDFQTEAVSDAIAGRANLMIHCYRLEDMAQIVDLSKEFGFKVRAFHHAVEAYKDPRLFKENGICAVIWGGPDWGGFKMEAYDSTALAAALLERAGACVALHSDSMGPGEHLNIDAARSLAAAQRAGLDISYEEAIRWITLNSAKVLGIDKETGSLEPGKMADIVVWSRDPFSSYAYADQVLIDGVETFRHGDPRFERPADIELGNTGQRNAR